MNRNLPIFVVLAWASWLAPAAAQSVYRCGDSYSHKPCPGGTLVPVEDARSASQRLQTGQAAQRDAKAAEVMEKARLKEEAKPAQGYIPADKPESGMQQERQAPVAAKATKPAQFTAVAPRKPGDTGSAKKDKKAKKKKTPAPT